MMKLFKLVKIESIAIKNIFAIFCLLFSSTNTFAFISIWAEGILSTQSENNKPFYQLVTSGKATPSLICKDINPASLNSHFVQINLRSLDITSLAGIEFRAYSKTRENFFYWNVPLFKDQDFNLLQGGEWTSISFSLGNAKKVGQPIASNITEIGLWIIDRGQKQVTVDVQNLVFVPKPSQGLVSLTFDDSYKEHFTVAAIEMHKLGLTGTAYVMPEQIGLQQYLNVQDLKNMKNMGWDIAAHHFLPFTEISSLEEEVIKIQKFLQTFKPGDQHVAYPLGKQNPKIRRLIEKKFISARIASAGPETLPPASPHLLRAVNVLSSHSEADLMSYVEMAKKDKMWVIFMFHHLKEPELDETYFSPTKFKKFLTLLKKSKVKVKPISQVVPAI